MLQNDWTFLNVTPETHVIMSSVYAAEDYVYKCGIDANTQKPIVIVSPCTYDKIMNPLQYSYEDVEMEMP